MWGPASMPNRYAGCDSIGQTCKLYREIEADLPIGVGKMNNAEATVLRKS